MSKNTSRRQFIRTTAAASAGAWVLGNSTFSHAARVSANEKLTFAIIGAGGRGRAHVDGFGRLKHNLAFLCDVDKAQADGAIKSPFTKGAKFYQDYRELFEKEHKNFDAVAVATPDHMHAPISIPAMELGKHCYCEKPLSWSIEEAQIMADTARRNNVATQMGNQGTASSGLRAGVEKIRDGVIGDVKEVHVWTNRPVWTQAVPTPKGQTPPATLDWDLWLGCAPERPYNSTYAPFHWRGWYDFGTGALGDMACHTMNLPYLALELGYPTSVEAVSSPLFEGSFPAWTVITFKFPARGKKPPVTLTWYDGGKNGKKPPKEILHGEKMPASGMVMVGSKGSMFSPDDYGAKQVLLPRGNFNSYKAPKRTLPRTGGHHLEFAKAAMGGPAAMSNFDHAAPFTQTVLLGNLAVRAQKKIIWDSKNMRAKGLPEVDHLIRRNYRHGFSI